MALNDESPLQLLESERLAHDVKVAEMEEKLGNVTETVKAGFQSKESDIEIEQGMLEELHKQLLGAGKVCAL